MRTHAHAREDHETTLSLKQIKFLRHLLTERTIAAATAKAGIHRTTFYAWIKEPAFKAEYEHCRILALTIAKAELNALSLDAAELLHECLKEGYHPHVRVHAAGTILRNAQKLTQANHSAPTPAIPATPTPPHVIPTPTNLIPTPTTPTPTSFPLPPTPHPHLLTSFPHPPTSFPHPPTSFPRRRESGTGSSASIPCATLSPVHPRYRTMPIESQTNGRIATLLDRMNSRWTALAENKGVFQGSQRQPDILVIQQGGRPVVIENEYAPAAQVEAEALGRLGEHLDSEVAPASGRIDAVIALKSPIELRNCGGLDEVDSLLTSGIALEYALYRGQPPTPPDSQNADSSQGRCTT